jgi:exosortase family protein XrtF
MTFAVVYGILTISYKFYLDFSDGSKHYPDYVTSMVAKQSKLLINSLGYSANIEAHNMEPSMKLLVNNRFVARVVEGCNSISVIILFLSFILAFSASIKSTFLFGFAGSVLIYAVNLFRIAVLSIGLYRYPWRSDLLHTVVFPLIIYGLVFVLWMLWVYYYSKQQKYYAKSA